MLYRQTRRLIGRAGLIDIAIVAGGRRAQDRSARTFEPFANHSAILLKMLI
jgi:hypothetical protein